jgi:hypothetical protein
MNLPLINNDNANNSFFGYHTNNLIYAPDSIGFTSVQCANWINGFFGQTCAFADSTRFNLILPVNFESLSLPATATKFRFNVRGISPTNQNPSTTTDNVRYCAENCVDLRQNVFNSSSSYYWAVLNSHSLNVLTYNTLKDQTNAYLFFSCGWLKNSLFFGSTFVRSAYYLFMDNLLNNQNFRAAGRPLNEFGNTQRFAFATSTTPNPIVNYPVSCQSATPGANTTEFYLRDNVAPNKAVGYVPNLLKSSLDIPVGQTYRNTGIDPDGSNMNTWKCVGKIGGESLLMRVWTAGLA